jgi:RNA polymerase sigma-70 factor (ECF subfamily)
MTDVDDTALRPVRDERLAAADLRRRLRRGDESALAELYDAHAALVHGLALRVTGDRAAAEAVTEEVFVTAWEHPEAFDPAAATVAGWLAGLAHRVAVDRVRRRGVPTGPAPTGAVGPTSPVPAPLAEPVRAAVAALAPEDRTALLLAYFGGRTYRQVGDVLGIPPDTARARIGAALLALAATLTAEGVLS